MKQSTRKKVLAWFMVLIMFFTAFVVAAAFLAGMK